MFARVSVQPRSELIKQTLIYKGGSEPGLGIEYYIVMLVLYERFGHILTQFMGGLAFC